MAKKKKDVLDFLKDMEIHEENLNYYINKSSFYAMGITDILTMMREVLRLHILTKSSIKVLNDKIKKIGEKKCIKV